MDGNPQDGRLQRPGTRRRYWSLAGALVLVAGAVLWWFERQIPPDPIYQGKALSAWLQNYAPSSPYVPHSPEWKETDAAVRQIGPNGIPLLVQMLRQRDSKLKVWLRGVAQKHGLDKRLHLVPAAERNVEASRAFVALGDLASGAVPDLIKAYQEHENPECRSAIEDALAWIGPGAKAAVPLLLEAVSDSNVRIRANAFWALGEIHADPQLCVPQLIQGLEDSDSWARLSAAHALGGFGTNARPAVAALTEMASLTNVNSSGRPFGTLLGMRMQERFEARRALERIDPLGFLHLNETSPVSGFFTNGGFELVPNGF